MPLFLDSRARGRYIKLGTAWVKLADIISAEVVGVGAARRLRIHRRGGRPPHDYGGVHLDRVRAIVEREMGRD